MKKRIKDVLKAMGSALEVSHAGEMLTRSQKAHVLEQSNVPRFDANLHKKNTR
jgi:hypothetical protein